MTAISVKNLVKEFRVPVREKGEGRWSAVMSTFFRKWESVQVLKSISFDVEEGEFVGYVGPNGAGKSTTIKILTGILSPSSGEVRVLGFSPQRDRYKYSYNIGVVFGQRTLLDFDIPVINSFKLYRDIYELSSREFEERLDYFSKILKIDEFMHIPVRKLSLGQRMRAEIVTSFLHRPKVVFLDEPTIGLDAVAKEEVRGFLRRINRDEKVTIILTTHDMDDIEQTCERILMIDAGKIIFDGPLSRMKKEFMLHKRIEFAYDRIVNQRLFDSLLGKAKVETSGQNRLAFMVDTRQQDIPRFVDELLSSAEITDLSVHEPRLESIIREIYLKQHAK